MKGFLNRGLLTLFVLGFAFMGEAAFVGNETAYRTGEVLSVEQAKIQREDTKVTMQGNIEKHLRKDHYLFRDETGSITVEIDDDIWQGLVVTPKDTVRVMGEVDQDFNSIKVEIDHIEVVKKQ